MVKLRMTRLAEGRSQFGYGIVTPVSAIPAAADVLAADLEVLPLPEVADRMGLPVTRVHQLLRDQNFSTDEILRWLFTEDESLPGTPIEALRGDRGREVKRRAQAMGF